MGPLRAGGRPKDLLFRECPNSRVLLAVKQTRLFFYFFFQMFFYRDTRWVHGKKSYTGILERETPGFMGILLVQNGHLWIPVCNAPSNNICHKLWSEFYVLWLQVPVFYSWVESFQQNSGLLFFFVFCFFPFLGL